MTDETTTAPLADANEIPADRFAQLPEGVEPDVAEERIKRAFERIGARKKEKRVRALELHMAAERAEALRLNRANALRTVVADGVTLHFAACACRWHGLRVSDPEVALREYDAHPCTIPFDEVEADHPAFRDLRMVDGRLAKRPASTLALNQVLPSGEILNTITAPVGAEVVVEKKPTTLDEDAATRAALLELK